MSDLSQLSHKQLTSLDQGGQLWEKYRQACIDSFYFFVKAVWSTIPPERNLLTFQSHGAITTACEDESITRLLIEYPRKMLKSSIVTVARPPWILCRSVFRGLDPNTRFGIYASTSKNSGRQWRDIKNTFETNLFFQFLWPELIPSSFDNTKLWNTEEGSVPRIYDPKDPTFDTLGGGKATSRHYDDLTLDDMINEENVDSPTAIEKAIEYYRLATNLLEDNTSRLIVVGNRWAMNDLNYYIHHEEPEVAVLSVSCYGPNLDGKYKCRHLPPSTMEILRQMPQGEPIWPERFDREALGDLLRRLKPRIFSAQFLNNPTDPEAVDFKLEWLKDMTVQPDKITGKPVIHPHDLEPVALEDCNVYITWDPALDGPSSSSLNAIIVTAMDHRGYIYILDEYAKKEDPLISMDSLLNIAERYAGYLKATGVEEVLFQKVLGKLLQQRARERGIFLGIRRLKTPTGMRKDQRIRAWVGSLFEARRIYVRRTVPKFIEQYSYFGIDGAQRDLIDAFAYATQLWTKPPSPTEREDTENQREFVGMDRGITGYGSSLMRTTA